MVKKSEKVYLEENESHSSAAKTHFETRLVLWSIVEAIQEIAAYQRKKDFESLEDPGHEEEADEAGGEGGEEEKEEEEEEEKDVEKDFEDPVFDLPFFFGSKKKNNHNTQSLSNNNHNKRKRKKKNRPGKNNRLAAFSKKRRKTSGDLKDLLWFFYRQAHDNGSQHRIQEENVFYYYRIGNDGNDDSKFHLPILVQVVGLAPCPLSPSSSSSSSTGYDVKIRFLQSLHYEITHSSQLIPLDHRNSHFPEEKQQHQLLETLEQEQKKNKTVYEEIDDDHWYRLLIHKPSSIHEKYWDQRYRLFTRYDEGILLDEESWYSITYESIGNHVIDRCFQILQEKFLSSKKGKGKGKGKEIFHVMDGFSGCGGMSIPIARRGREEEEGEGRRGGAGCLVTAIDFDEKKLKYLK